MATGLFISSGGFPLAGGFSCGIQATDCGMTFSWPDSVWRRYGFRSVDTKSNENGTRYGSICWPAVVCVAEAKRVDFPEISIEQFVNAIPLNSWEFVHKFNIGAGRGGLNLGLRIAQLER
jgi:hypothetical protein